MTDRRKLWLPLAVLGLALFGGFVLMLTAPPVESVTPERTLSMVRVIEGRPETVQLWVHSQGTVAPRTESELVPEVSGPVTWVSPALVSGGFYSEGDPLLRVDRLDYEAAVARARANVARATGEWEHAKSELNRRQKLSKSAVASASQLSEARRAARVSEAALAEARVTFEQAERDLDRTEIRAPFSGRVRVERVDVGQFVSRGASIATLYATDFAEIRLPIADRELAYLELGGMRGERGPEGPQVRLRATFAGQEHEWLGTVVRTEGEIDARSRLVHVVALVEDPYGTVQESPRPPLAVGLFVRAAIAGPLAHDVIVLPRAALRDEGQILIVDAEDRLQLRNVEVLRIQRDDVLIRAQLAPEERICVSPLQVVVEGMHVRPVAEAEGRS